MACRQPMATPRALLCPLRKHSDGACGLPPSQTQHMWPFAQLPGGTRATSICSKKEKGQSNRGSRHASCKTGLLGAGGRKAGWMGQGSAFLRLLCWFGSGSLGSQSHSRCKDMEGGEVSRPGQLCLPRPQSAPPPKDR